MASLQEGTKLAQIYYTDGGSLQVGCDFESRTVTDIYITIVNGQMAGVPWACCVWSNGDETMYNLAQLEGIVLAKDGE
jgi:hypothetical protein